MISGEDDNFVRNISVTDMISNHIIVDIKLLDINKPGMPKKSVTYRKYRAINITQLAPEILKSKLVVTPHSTLENLVEQHNTRLCNLIDKHALAQSKVFIEIPLTS